jgi:hypothetical protein
MKNYRDKSITNRANRLLGDLASTIFVGGLVLLGITGCARVSVENVNVRALGLPRPQMIYVHDFAVSADAVALDSALGARALEMAKGTETEDRIKIGQEIARIVSENLVNEIRAQGMPAQLAGSAAVMAADLAPTRRPACASRPAATCMCQTLVCSPRLSATSCLRLTISMKPSPARGNGT